MPVQKAQSSLIGKLGNRLREAAAVHQNDEVEFSSFGDLPPGINNGIARLVECKFTQIKEGKQNAGEYMFYAAGVVLYPKSVVVDGVIIPTEGKRTQISEPIFDTPTRTRKTIADHVGHVQNEMKKLGASAAGLGGDDLEATAAALKQVGPTFKFRTWQGPRQTTGPYKDKDPQVAHFWDGAVEYAEAEDGPPDVQDDSGPAGSTNGVATAAAPKSAPTKAPPAATKAPAKKPTTPAPAPEPEPEQFNEFAEDPDALLAQANAGDEGAMKRLAEMAVAAGASEADVAGAADWDAVRAMVGGGAEAEGADGSEGKNESGGAEWTPAVEEIYLYKAPSYNAKTKKVVVPDKPVECEVMSVDPAGRTVTLKNLITGNLVADYKTKKVMAVSWDALESAGS